MIQFAAAAAPKPNGAVCIKTTGMTQSCSITQTNGTADNVAAIYENAGKQSGLTQTASYTASITQQATGNNSNKACVFQSVSVDGSTVAKKGTPVNVNLEAHQSISVTQDAFGSGSNAIGLADSTGGCDTSQNLSQIQTLSSDGTGAGPITQNLNAANNGPNLALNIAQNQNGASTSASGASTANFTQQNDLSAVASTTGGGPVNQTQSSPTGGIDAIVNQFSTQGPLTINATQHENQCERAGNLGTLPTNGSLADCLGRPKAGTLPTGWTETQFGPASISKSKTSRKRAGHQFYKVSKGSSPSSQTGTSNATFNVTQTSFQTNDDGLNQTNNVQGDCSTSGANCTVNQTANGTTNSNSGQTVSAGVNCTGNACIAFNGSPGTNAPPATLGPYTMTPFGADPQALCTNNGTVVPALTTSVAGPTGTVQFDEALNHDRIGGPPNCWATWSNGYTGDVYDTIYSTNRTQATMTLPSNTAAFYFYAEPNVFNTFTIQATSQDGTTSGPVAVNGNAGAKYFGFYGTGGATISTITVTTSDSSGFAVGEFGIAPVPIP